MPRRDFDPTEAAIPWKVLTAKGHKVLFATPDGRAAAADPIMLDGVGLDPWGWAPGLRRLRAIGFVLRANAEARNAYAKMQSDAGFRRPLKWDALRAEDFNALVLPGGHRARGMREYLESEVLQSLVVAFFAADKPVGAICHGVLLAARSRDAAGRSVLYSRRTAALTWSQERLANRLARFGRWWDPTYYRTYPELAGQPKGFMSVEQEVTRALARPEDFVQVPPDAPHGARKTSGRHRDSASDTRPSWVVRDGRYVSARWPGDAHLFAMTLNGVLSEQGAAAP